MRGLAPVAPGLHVDLDRAHDSRSSCSAEHWCAITDDQAMVNSPARKKGARQDGAPAHWPIGAGVESPRLRGIRETRRASHSASGAVSKTIRLGQRKSVERLSERHGALQTNLVCCSCVSGRQQPSRHSAPPQPASNSSSVGQRASALAASARRVHGDAPDAARRGRLQSVKMHRTQSQLAVGLLSDSGLSGLALNGLWPLFNVAISCLTRNNTGRLRPFAIGREYPPGGHMNGTCSGGTPPCTLCVSGLLCSRGEPTRWRPRSTLRPTSRRPLSSATRPRRSRVARPRASCRL